MAFHSKMYAALTKYSKTITTPTKGLYIRGRFILRRYSVGLVLFSVPLIAALRIRSGDSSDVPQSIVALCGFAAVTIAYVQWIAVRQEISFDKYYDRLAIVNTKHDKWREEATRLDKGIQYHLEWESCKSIPERGHDYKSSCEELEEHCHMSFVFSELDVLEYALEKYELGYIHPDIKERAKRSFDARCAERLRFCIAVLWAVGETEDFESEGKPHAPAFGFRTRKVAREFAMNYLPVDYLPSLVRGKYIVEEDKSWSVAVDSSDGSIAPQVRRLLNELPKLEERRKQQCRTVQ